MLMNLGNRVARIEGARYSELETLLNQYQIQNSDLDLFTEFADDGRGNLSWGDGVKAGDPSRTP